MKINLIDIGSVGGLEPPWAQHPSLIGTTLSFEPNERAVEDPRRMKSNFAVWNHDGEGQFTIFGQNGTGSSLLEPNVEWIRENFDSLRRRGDPRLAHTFFERVRERRVEPCQVRKLDTILDGLPGRPRFHFMKSDTQSGEWFVLDGARRYLAGECLGLELECYRDPMYRGMKLEADVFALLVELGFERWGWTGYKATFASQADYLFLRQPRDAEEAFLVDAIKRMYGTNGPASIIKRKPFGTRLRVAMARVASSITT